VSRLYWSPKIEEGTTDISIGGGKNVSRSVAPGSPPEIMYHSASISDQYHACNLVPKESIELKKCLKPPCGNMRERELARAKRAQVPNLARHSEKHVSLQESLGDILATTNMKGNGAVL
jgi:hypothetical protein